MAGWDSRGWQPWKRIRFICCWLFLSFFGCISEEITVKRQANGILLTCGGKAVFTRNDSPDLKLEYKDENSGEYECVPADTKDKPSKIYVKFRSKFRVAGGFCSLC